jgi:hypothetical protein
MRDKVAFGVLAIALSIALYAIFWWSEKTGPHLAGYSMGFLIPALALMLAALGVEWRRKTTFVGLTIAGFFLIELAASVSGAAAASARGVSPSNEPVAFLMTLVYLGVSVGFPVVMLILLVGNRPSQLWTRRP